MTIRASGRPEQGGARRGFTLIELLVVITIIAILIALLLPAVQAIRQQARTTQCQNNLKQLGLAFHSYEGIHKFFPTSYARPSGSAYEHGWVTHILPFIEQNQIADKYNWRANWYDAVNQPAVDVDIPVVLCPAAPTTSTKWNCDYGINSAVSSSAYTPQIAANLMRPRIDWSGMIVNGGSSVSDVKDGLSNTMMIREDAGRPDRWVNGRKQTGTTSGARWADDDQEYVQHDFCNGSQQFNCHNDNEDYAFHSQGMNVVMGDGVVRFITINIAPDTWVSLATAKAQDLLDSQP